MAERRGQVGRVTPAPVSTNSNAIAAAPGPDRSRDGGGAECEVQAARRLCERPQRCATLARTDTFMTMDPVTPIKCADDEGGALSPPSKEN